jgi:dipeptidyl aminopeptidase/acylaminoacyl peptidase
MLKSMRRQLVLFALAATPAVAQAPFTLQQVLSAPFATSLTAAPASDSKVRLFAWVENAEGRHNLWVGGVDADGKLIPARALTNNPDDDAQDISQLAWSPDAKFIAYTYGAENGADGKPANPAHLQRATPVQVIVQPIAPDAKPLVIGEGHAPLFTQDGASLLYVRDGQIWIAELSERKQCMLPEGCPAAPANPAAPTHQLVFDRGSASQLTFSPDGTLLAFISRRREANEPSHSLLALYNLSTHKLTFPSPGTGNQSAPAFSPDGKQLAWVRTPFTDTAEFANPRTSASPWAIRMISLSGGKAFSFVEPAKDRAGSVLPHLATGEPQVYWTHPAPESATRVLYFDESSGFVNLLGRAFGGIHAGPLDDAVAVGEFEVEDVDLSSDGHTLTWASNNATADPLDVDRRHLWQADVSGADMKAKMLTHGEGIETHPALSGDGSTLAALVSDAHTPMHAALIGKDGTITPLHAEALPADYPAAALVTPQQVLFDSDDGLHLHGQLFGATAKADPSPTAQDDKVVGNDQAAAGDKGAGNDKTVAKHPAILFFHGGPHRQMLLGYPAMGYYSNAYAMNQYLTARGYIVLSVNYRCGIGYGMAFRQCEHQGPTGAAEYNDVLAAVKYLQSRPDVDATRLGIWGGSYGGLLTAQALARNSDIFAAGVDFHGVHDWNLEDNAADWKRGSYAEKDAIGADALKSSPMADVDKWKSPVLLIHGDNDPEVAYAQTPLLAEALRARHVPVEELIFPDEVHAFLLHRDWLAAYTAEAAFFERILKP